MILKFLLTLKLLFNLLDEGSVAQALAFYELYPESKEGKEALARVRGQLQVEESVPVEMLCTPINRFQAGRLFSEEELAVIERVGKKLPTRDVKGANVTTEKEMLELPSDQIDLGRALLLSQLGESKESLEQVRNYSALLDLMALQVLARVSHEALPEEKIAELNRFVFEEMRFRFPPQSLYAKEIDLYTFLPNVMDNHLGVCLGVTTLYLALADRIELPLEIITPPGHIFLRYRKGDKKINIETTARGIDLPDEKYLSLQVKELQVRERREVIGMTHVNKASTHLYRGEFDKAAATYAKALPYMEDDPLVNLLYGFSLLLSDDREKGREVLQKVKEMPHERPVAHEDVIDDYFAGHVDEEGIASIFLEVDEKKSSILAKQGELLKVAKKYPRFRAGLEQLAVSYLQLDRFKEGLFWLEKLHALGGNNPTTAYYLAVASAKREDYASCWRYLKEVEALVTHKPKALKELRQELQILSPELK